MKRFFYLSLLFFGIITWLISVVSMAITMWLAQKGDKLFPSSPISNCWIFALTRYWNQGGYLLIRAADDIRLFKNIRVPHAIYLPTVPPDLDVEQFIPNKRTKNKWLPWKTLWYEGTVKNTEKPH